MLSSYQHIPLKTFHLYFVSNIFYYVIMSNNHQTIYHAIMTEVDLYDDGFIFYDDKTI